MTVFAFIASNSLSVLNGKLLQMEQNCSDMLTELWIQAVMFSNKADIFLCLKNLFIVP